jgi:ubiquinone/menaquinone biosynthesis C-methylase UbiE
MQFFQKFRNVFNIGPAKQMPAEEAYNLWADDYDAQPDNLMLAWDEQILSEFLPNVDLKNKVIADIGCGTGRHWNKFLAEQPHKIIGFDVSERMLHFLQQKFPGAETYALQTEQLTGFKKHSFDIIISTLTIAHIKNIKSAMMEWDKVLKPGGEMIITDYHPAALKKGGKRTFKHDNETIEVKNYVHSIELLRLIAQSLQLTVNCFIEKRIDQTAKKYYENQNALPLFEAWKGVPIIYGLHLIKENVAN